MVSFEAESVGPPHRKLYLWSDDPDRPKTEQLNGWSFQVTQFDDSGVEIPLRDAWALTYSEILKYPELYAPREIEWRRLETSSTVNIYELTY